MEKKKIILVIALLLGLCGEKSEKKKNSVPSGFEKVHLIESKGDILSFELFAFHVVDREDSVLLIDFKVIFYDSLARKTGELKADSGWVDRKSLNILAKKNVVLKTEKESLLTQEALWIDSLKIAKSDKDVALYHEGNITYGKGFVTEKNLKEITIKGRVTGGEKD